MPKQLANFKTDPQTFLSQLYDIAVDAAQPMKAVPRYMPKLPKDGRVFVIGAGKASAQMAQAFETHWTHHKTHPLSGIVITRYGYAAPCDYVEILEAAHPVPDEAGIAATEKLFTFLKDAKLTDKDLVVCLISGGGSALLVKPIAGMTLADKAAINTSLLRSGAPIQKMNIVRKAMSQVKGGGLARACAPARLHSLLISDVAGDDVESIASAPTIVSKMAHQAVLKVINDYKIDVPKVFMDHLQAADNMAIDLADPPQQDVYVIASAKMSLKAAALAAQKVGLDVKTISDALEGDSRECAQLHMDLIKTRNFKTPYLLLSGGETTVKVRGNGRGGNNGQFAIEFLNLMADDDKIYGLAADTDGIDGSEDNAGAFFTPALKQKAREKGLDINAYIQNNDSYGFFEQVYGLLVTGPTQTNVNDFRAILVIDR